ncbi:hypothetical protein L598_000700000490 [Mesorhizobium sp. J18]|uniref:hypothetical protein n=1 Tax=Mesorhizobium sp. J18 TaxID=935263 RepID=UPI00119BB8CF|nr:hypothetical protein [Mesorhizobium sp. J18]TWG90293.1 hypothetical protein L598_000700000490 [Mesorhizobium sp. J18]
MSPRNPDRPSPGRIDREWPHQVALPDDICTDRNFTLIRAFCEERGLKHHIRKVQAVWPDRRYQDMRLYCFADRASAELFQARFGGEFFDPKRDREGGRVEGAWKRQGVWTRLLESGPLKVPVILRD